VKVNWDATMDKNSMKIGMGVIVRDGMGEVLVSGDSVFAKKPYY
jgi:hypothetical protein